MSEKWEDVLLGMQRQRDDYIRMYGEQNNLIASYHTRIAALEAELAAVRQAADAAELMRQETYEALKAARRALVEVDDLTGVVAAMKDLLPNSDLKTLVEREVALARAAQGEEG